jgi:hypothetical protein
MATTTATTTAASRCRAQLQSRKVLSIYTASYCFRRTGHSLHCIANTLLQPLARCSFLDKEQVPWWYKLSSLGSEQLPVSQFNTSVDALLTCLMDPSFVHYSFRYTEWKYDTWIVQLCFASHVRLTSDSTPQELLTRNRSPVLLGMDLLHLFSFGIALRSLRISLSSLPTVTLPWCQSTT